LSLFTALGAGAAAVVGELGLLGALGLVGDDRAGGAFGAGSGPLAAAAGAGFGAGFATAARVGAGAAFFGSGFAATFGAGFGSDLGAEACGSGGSEAIWLDVSIADGGSLPMIASPTPATLDTWIKCPHLRHFMRTERPATFSSAI
jgi:hypothetical protein